MWELGAEEEGPGRGGGARGGASVSCGAETSGRVLRPALTHEAVRAQQLHHSQSVAHIFPRPRKQGENTQPTFCPHVRRQTNTRQFEPIRCGLIRRGERGRWGPCICDRRPHTHSKTQSSESKYTRARLCNPLHPRPILPTPTVVTQYDFLQIPKSDPGWNISARLPRHCASAVLPSPLLFLFTLQKQERR